MGPFDTTSYTLLSTPEFDKWFSKLSDQAAKRAISVRPARVSMGNFGDAKRIENISELRVDVGQGYRVYYTIRRKVVVLLLLGGDKRSQKADIIKAKALANQPFSGE